MCCRAEGASETVIYKVEVPANRYDLLCVEGLVLGLLIFQQKCSAPVYRRLSPDNMLELYTKPATADVRPFVVAAVLRGVTMTPDRYQSFIDLQVLCHYQQVSCLISMYRIIISAQQVS